MRVDFSNEPGWAGKREINFIIYWTKKKIHKKYVCYVLELSRSALKSLKSKRSGQNWSAKIWANILYFVMGMKQNCHFFFGPSPDLKKYSFCRSVLEGDKVEKRKSNHACMPGQSQFVDSLFYLFIA